MSLTKEQKIERITKAGYKFKVCQEPTPAYLALRWDKNYKAKTISELFRQIFGY